MAPAYSRLPVNHDVLEGIFGYLNDAATLMRLRRVCHEMRLEVDDFATRRYDVTKMLQPLVQDVLALRQLQASVGAVFGGSRVMKFFQDCDWADRSDLDIFMYPGTAGVIALHLLTVEGYSYEGVDLAADLAGEPAAAGFSLYNMTHVRRVYKFRKGDLKIDLVAATEDPLQTILHFHSTPVVNGITWNRAFSVFAYATWARHMGMVLDDNKRNPALDKYRARGFKLFNARVALTHSFRDHLRTGYRWIGDSSTWVLDLGTAGLFAPAVSDRLSNTSFAVVGLPRCSGPGILVTTEYHVETVYFTHSLLSTGWTVCVPMSLFADAVIGCVRRRWLATGKPFAAQVKIGSAGTSVNIDSWDRLFDLLSISWHQRNKLLVRVYGELATFYPLGGAVISRNFMG